MITKTFLVLIALCLSLPDTSSLICNKITGQSLAHYPPQAWTVLKWAVSVLQAGLKPNKFICGGSLISKSFVITGKFFKCS